MNSLTSHPDFDAHEQLVMLDLPDQGLTGIICIHSTALGPAAGGCRMATYETSAAALTDALRLSRGMSYKNALAGLSVGGGKAVLMKAAPKFPRAAIFAAFAAAVEKLGGRYITAEDVGTSVADMQVVARHTRFVGGLPNRGGQAGGDPSPWTALGVFAALQACIERPLAGSRVAVQGLGAVGYKLCERLHRAGAKLVVADVDQNATARAQHEFGAEIVAVERIHAVAADVYSPNALGATLNAVTIPELGAPVICGGANNQLASPASGQALLSRGVTYAPDYVVNAGGIINVMAEYNGEPAHGVEARVLAIGARVADILSQAKQTRRPPSEVADAMARSMLSTAKSQSAPSMAGACT